MSRKPSAVASRVPALFQKTDVPASSASTAETSERSAVQTAQSSNVQTAEQPAVESTKKRTKVTYYLPPEDVVLLDRLRQQEFLRTGKRTELSSLVSEAIKLLGREYQQNT